MQSASSPRCGGKRPETTRSATTGPDKAAAVSGETRCQHPGFGRAPIAARLPPPNSFARFSPLETEQRLSRYRREQVFTGLLALPDQRLFT